MISFTPLERHLQGGTTKADRCEAIDQCLRTHLANACQRRSWDLWKPSTSRTRARLHVPSCSGVPFAFSASISGTFNSLSKVLSTFPSRYLCAVVFGEVFRFRWNLPPNLRSRPRERDSLEPQPYALNTSALNGNFTLHTPSFQKVFADVSAG